MCGRGGTGRTAELPAAAAAHWPALARGAGLLAMLALSRVMVHGGLIGALAEAAATTGAVWPLLAPLIGVLGTFVTGSATASNIPSPSSSRGRGAAGPAAPALAAAQGFGSAVGNIIAPHNIIAGSATVGLVGREGAVLSRTLPICAAGSAGRGVSVDALGDPCAPALARAGQSAYPVFRQPSAFKGHAMVSILSGQFIDVIEWTSDTRAPWSTASSATATRSIRCQLTVREGQVAVSSTRGSWPISHPRSLHARDQQHADHDLAAAWDHGFKSPFKSEISFVTPTASPI